MICYIWLGYVLLARLQVCSRHLRPYGVRLLAAQWTAWGYLLHVDTCNMWSVMILAVEQQSLASREKLGHGQVEVVRRMALSPRHVHRTRYKSEGAALEQSYVRFGPLACIKNAHAWDANLQ